MPPALRKGPLFYKKRPPPIFHFFYNPPFFHFLTKTPLFSTFFYKSTPLFSTFYKKHPSPHFISCLMINREMFWKSGPWSAASQPSYTKRSLMTRVSVTTWLVVAKLGRLALGYFLTSHRSQWGRLRCSSRTPDRFCIVTKKLYRFVVACWGNRLNVGLGNESVPKIIINNTIN